MLPKPRNDNEKAKHEEFYKLQVQKAFKIIKPAMDFCDKREVSYIMRYLLQYPSEAQVRDYIIVKLEDDEPCDFIKYEKFEPYMINVLMNNEFEPAPAEHLLAAFRILDPQNTGRIKKEIIENLLATKGIPLIATEE